MRFNSKMIYLGMEQRESKKTGNRYFLVKTMDKGSSSIFEWYVAGDRGALIAKVVKMEVLGEYDVAFEVTAFNSKAQVDLLDVNVK